MKEITDRPETGIQQLFNSDRYKAYLTTMAKFHNYSFNNTLLIAMQGGQLVAGINQIKIQRSLTTSNVAVFVPFVTQELFQSGAAMYYGINAKSHNMIMLDRKQARCPNGLKLGTPGSGKSMSCKSEIVSVFLTTADDIFISDPEAEVLPAGQAAAWAGHQTFAYQQGLCESFGHQPELLRR